jgi:hypothetical protein
VKSLKKVIVLTDKAHMPQSALPNVVAYEEWIEGADGDFRWLEMDENDAAGMCYTSGTTGDPKGVVYSHRSNVLHAMIACMPDAMGISARDAILPIVPMFHANAWGLGQSGPMIGAKTGDARRQDGRRLGLRDAGYGKGHVQRGGSDGLADVACSISKRMISSCPTSTKLSSGAPPVRAW